MTNNALTQHIRQLIAENGFLPFADYMALALYHPIWGYYQRHAFTPGKRGDFTTAPEISPLFARCFAKQALEIFESLGQASILELGAGSGRFALDILLALDACHALPTHYDIYEVSSHLRQQQQVLLQAYPHLFSRIRWLDALPQHYSGLIIANEVLDALPVDCFYIENDGIKERAVGLKEDNFVWQLRAPLSIGFIEKAENLRENHQLYQGYASEIHSHLETLIKSLANLLDQGVILLADYGYGEREYYHPQRKNGTLTCFYQHHYHDNPLILPGEQDITAHVNFTAVIETAHKEGCDLLGFTHQAAFLMACGLMELTHEEANNLNAVDTFQLHQAIKRLTLPTEMGERIKIMALAKNLTKPLLGFRLKDGRREL